MQLKEYIDLALRTESSLSPLTKEVEDRGLTNRTFHGVIGVNTEVGEMIECIENGKFKADEPENAPDWVNLLEECGDALWYLAIKIDELFGLDYDHFQDSLNRNSVDTLDKRTIEELIERLRFSANEELDYSKKVMMYGKDDDNMLKFQNCTFVQFLLIIRIINKVTKKADSIEQVMKVNIAKLNQRYPDKFSTTDADIRDLVSERTILESLPTPE